MADLTVLLEGHLKSESRKYLELRKEFDRTKQDRDKVMKRLRLLKELLALERRDVDLPDDK